MAVLIRYPEGARRTRERRARRVRVAMAIALVYLGLWAAREPLGLQRPMANLRYVHYGAAPRAASDWLLYALFWPCDRVARVFADGSDGARGIHWSERRDPDATDG